MYIPARSSGSIYRPVAGILALAALIMVSVLGALDTGTQATVNRASARPIGITHNLALQQSAWSPNVRVNSDNSGFGQHEPSLAVSPTNPNVVVVANKDYRESDIKRVWIEVSRDGGQTWPTQLHMPGLPPTMTESDPVVVARDDGRIYVACLTTGPNGLFITWTDDNGLNWHPSIAVANDQTNIQDKPWFTIDNNPASPYYHRMYMAWAPSLVVSAYSKDGGLTWSASATLPVNNEQQGSEYPYPVVASNGDVLDFYLANWQARYPQTSTIRVTKSTDGGATWGAPVKVSDMLQPPSPVRDTDQWRFFSVLSAAADPTKNNRFYIAWTDYRHFNTAGVEVLYSESNDHGITWSMPARLSHDPANVVRDHITPVLKVDGNGTLHAFWLDRRLDPANSLFEAWYSRSTDGGVSWSPDEQVSDAPAPGFNLNTAFPPVSGNAAGDYWGLDVGGGYAYAAWTDTRDGNQDIYTSKRPLGNSQPNPTVTPIPTLRVLTATATQTVGATGTPQATPLPLPGSGSFTFPETGQTVTGLFLQYWQGAGGLAQQGYPISPVVPEVSDLNGKSYTVQYFERAVFEYHPENPPPYDVLLSQLGTVRYKEKYPDGAPGQQADASPGSVFFPETGHRLGGLFLEYWQSHGGLMQQGYPISDVFTEVSDLDGKPYTVQYFERAVFEYHPENPPPYNVLLSQLGTFRYKEKYGAP